MPPKIDFNVNTGLHEHDETETVHQIDLREKGKMSIEVARQKKILGCLQIT